MQLLIRRLCTLSILCGAALSIAPEGASRRAMRFVCSVVLTACALFGAFKLDTSGYAVQQALQREREQQFLARSEEALDALDRLVMEREYAAYIEKQGRALGVELRSVSVQARWNTEGLWVPDSVSLRCAASGEGRARLAQKIYADFGIPPEKQEWRADDES